MGKSVNKTLSLLLAFTLPLLCTVGAEARADGTADAIAALSALVRDPAHAPPLPIDTVTLHARDHKLYDHAFTAVRHALMVHPENATIRMRYAELLFWRHAVHPEQDSLRRATDEAIIALRDHPANQAAARFLAAPAVLDAQLKRLTNHQLDALATSMKRTLERSPDNLVLLRALVRLEIGMGQSAEARTLTHRLAMHTTDPAGALCLEGVAELADKDAAGARKQFAAALTHPAETSVEAVAELGLAESLRRLGEPESAADALDRARELLAAAQLDHLSRELGLPSPEIIAWRLGKALAAAGDVGRADLYLGANGMHWDLSHSATSYNNQGFELYKAGRLEAAQQSFARAAQLSPGDPIILGNIAFIAFKRRRCNDAEWYFEKLREVRPLTSVDAWSLAMCQAITGDYASAARTMSYARDKARNTQQQDSAAQWAVVFDYGAHGWAHAYALWSSTLPAAGTIYITKAHALDTIRGGLEELATRAREANMRYAEFLHQNMRYRAETEPLDAWDTDYHPDREHIMQRIAALYAKLPLKPAIPRSAILRVTAAKKAVARHDLRAAAQAYQQAIRIAPWWPLPHFALAIASEFDASDTSKQEMAIYFTLVPKDSPEARPARRFLARFRPILPGQDIGP